MNIVERMSRAIAVANGNNPDDPQIVGGGVSAPQWHFHEEEVRAALRSVKPSDISDEMIAAAFKALGGTDKDIAGVDWAERESLRRAIAAAIAAGAETNR